MKLPSLPTNIDELRQLVRKLGLRLNTDLGQHFLVDPEILARIAQTPDISPQDRILEIGPGIGTLTTLLACRVPDGLVLGIEKDRRFVEYLREQFSSVKQVKIVCDDVVLYLKSEGLADFGPYHVVSNLPYQITGPILRWFLDPARVDPPTSVTLMLQHEVAARLLASPGRRERGLLTILRELYGPAEHVLDAPPDQFLPPPEVTSSVITIRHQPTYPPELAQRLARLAKIGFQTKRKKLLNVLAGGLHLPKDKLRDIFTSIDLNPDLRAEDLLLSDWFKLVESF